MTPIKACIFDLDGVIVDTAKFHYLAWRRLAQELGFDFTEEDNERLKGVSRMDSLNILLEIGGVELDNAKKEELAKNKNEWYVELISEMDEKEILPGTTEFLTLLKEAGVKISLGSASKNAKMILKKINLLHMFDCIIDGTNISKAKPDPEVFLLGANALKVDPSECVVFEDAVSGVEAAISAGMYVIGIGTKETLHRANDVVGSLAEMTLDRLER
ncbi:beta-phosphoglucomutase [Anaerobacillus isosaccharinicus]|uniref:Beta-phosphoglucomutase n=1 Tax=Anaerobacillus isosaccharinicus TaxID=1532552 RepID=A0A7S7L7B2_9BACI|nr:beta-phosphoglucomutase [Anaerobacillus isosaccharinicus]MBA5585995.1 beta-phosphoglucomutase [Anaerobacillus isosaccharinicus]QOY35727.1 beta-phosphoglucomutase [Anaerobacillus isosaccharinicus]